jgi:hypothetical protein
MEELELTGGLRTGGFLTPVGATAPYAKLRVNKKRLELTVPINSIELVFQPKDIISLEPYTAIPLIGKGIKINHRVSSYHQKVIFWTLSDPKAIISKIEETGFLSNTSEEVDNTIFERQKVGIFPLKKGFVILFAILWNIAIIHDLYLFFTAKPYGSRFLFGNGVLIASILGLLGSLLVLAVPAIRKLVLKEGQDYDDVKKIIYNSIITFIFFILFLLFIFN